MATGQRRDPYLGFSFGVVIEGLKVVGGFSEVTGLQAEVEIHDYREGGVNGYVHRLAGPVRYPSNIVLKRGMADVDALWGWYQDVVRGIIVRKNLTIFLADAPGIPKRVWNFEKACPVRWIGPQLRAATSEVAVETLELVHRGMLFT